MTEIDSKFEIKDFAPNQTLLKKKGVCMTKEMYNQKGFEKVLKETEASEVKPIVFKYRPKKG